MSYSYFLDKGFKFQPYVCNGCHDVLVMSMNLRNIAIQNIWGAGYCCTIGQISKSEARNELQNIDLTEKMEHYRITLEDVYHLHHFRRYRY